MKPSVAILGFVLGSSAAICFGLAGVALIFCILGPEHPELVAEVGSLVGHLGRFAGLTAVSAWSFYGMVRERPWRRTGVAVLVLTLAVLALSYAPLPA